MTQAGGGGMFLRQSFAKTETSLLNVATGFLQTFQPYKNLPSNLDAINNKIGRSRKASCRIPGGGLSLEQGNFPAY